MAILRSVTWRSSWSWTCIATATLIAWSPPADAQGRGISISARTLPKAIAELSREEGVSIGAEGSLPQVRTPRIADAASVAAALARLLAGTAFEARQVGPSAWRIERRTGPRTAEGDGRINPPTQFEDAPSAPIVVTATKRAQALADAPVALSVVQFHDDEDSDPQQDSASVVRQVEGVALAGQGPGRNRMFLRGVADSPFNGDSQSTVAVILDDTRLTYSAPDPDIRMVDVERVEVLKGPQGTLYGTGALGGIYRVVTRRPDPSRVAFEAGVESEVLASGEIGGSASVMANMPLVHDTAALRVVAYGGKSAGWVDTGADADSNSASVIGLRAGLGVEPGDGWRIDASGFGQWLNAADSSYVYSEGARSRPAQLAEPHDNDLRHVAIAARRGGVIDLTFASGMTWHEVRDRYDATQGAEGFGLTDPEVLDDDRHYRTWDSELRLSGAVGPVDWLAGLSHVEARQETETSLTSTSAATLALQGDHRIVSDSAVFGEATWALSSDFDLLAGGRIFRTHFQDQRLAGSDSLEISRTQVGATPALALSWRLQKGTLLYLRYGSAFRQGGSGLSETGQLEALAGDELATLEAGWRQALGDATLDFGAYFSRWENVQSDMLGADGLVTTRNAGDARILGVEGTFSGPLAPGWTLDAGATWQSALLVRNETGIELDDRRLPAIPEYTVRGTLSRKWMVGSVEAQVDLALRYLGPARLSFQPQLDLPMGDYLESSLEGHARWDRLRIGLKLANLFGTSADTLPYGNPLRIASMRQYTPQRPTAISFQLAWSL
jgi:outer membrane receptor protein involved in Fe transport